jgi:Cys-tRNA(Pro)/Cys-tRNA(Cys) deacylase
MTPAVNIAKKAKIPYTLHSYTHDPASASYGEEASEKLGIASDRVFKTLVAQIDGRELVVAVIPVSSMLSMKQIAKAAGGKKGEMAKGCGCGTLQRLYPRRSESVGTEKET